MFLHFYVSLDSLTKLQNGESTIIRIEKNRFYDETIHITLDADAYLIESSDADGNFIVQKKS